MSIKVTIKPNAVHDTQGDPHDLDHQMKITSRAWNRKPPPTTYSRQVAEN